jgi:hypothetical protein
MDGDIPIVDFSAEDMEEARRQTFAQRFMAGAELFDYVERISSAGIRKQHPEFTEAQVQAEFLRRINDESRAHTP